MCYARINDGGVKIRKVISLSIALFFFSGCGTTSYNKTFNKAIKLDGVIIHVVSSSEDFDNPNFKGSPTVKGYANGFEIWIVGSSKDGRIYVDSKLLGHELRHTLKARLSELVDPDNEDFLSLQNKAMITNYKLPWN